MPSVQDYDPSEEEDVQAGGGGLVPSGGGATQAADQPSKQREPGFTPWSRFVSANADVSKREADKLNTQVSNDIAGVKSGLNKADKAFGDAIEKNYEHGEWGQFGAIAPQQKAFSATPSASMSAVAQQRAKPQTPAFQAPAAPLGRTQLDPRGANTIAGTPQQPGLTAHPMETRTGLSAQGASNPTGPNSLEQAIGPNAWSSLLGDAKRAESEAGALGSQEGLQGLLQKQSATPLAQGGAFDAALIGGAGQKEFGQTAQAGKGLMGDIAGRNQGAQDAWKKLLGESAADQKIQATGRAANEAANAPNGRASAEAEAEKNRSELEKARTSFMKGMAAYTLASQVPGSKPGAINGLGTQEQFLDALKTGAQFGDGGRWENMPSVKEQMDAASNALGIPADKLAEYFSKMNPTEWQDFWLLGVIPPWMDGVKGFGYGKPGGWQSPFLQQMQQYGDDGGMWNAITNMWKDGAVTVLKGATGGPLGAGEAAVSAATYKGPGASKK